MSTVCQLDPTHFVSPPTSLYNQFGWQCWAILQHPDAHNIPDGIIYFQLYGVAEAITRIAFRVQEDEPWPVTLSYYEILLWHAHETEAWRIQPGPDILLATWPHTPPLDAWNRYLLAWTTICAPDATRTFHIELQIETPPTWTLIGQVDDPVNAWADSSINKVALSTMDVPHWLDDFRVFQYFNQLA